MKTLIYSILLLIGVLFSSCTNDFDSINTDPNRPKEIFPGVLLGQLQYKFVNTAIGGASGFTHEIMQVSAPRSSQNYGLHRYHIAPDTQSRLWTDMYNYMTDVEDLYDIADRLGQDNYKAIALIYKSWGYSLLTDTFGDVPYSEASKAAEGNFSPTFDKQKDIYIQILQDLEIANTLLDPAKPLLYGGDIVYEATNAAGILKWKKFCNSLKLRLLLRIFKRDGEVNVTEQLTRILDNPDLYPVFTSVKDDAIFFYPGSFPYFNPYFNARTLDWREGRYFTEYFINSLNEAEDPRRSIWSTTIDKDGEAIYIGIQSGYENEVEYQVNRHSSYNDGLKTLPGLGIMMTYAEVEFIKAELSLRDFSTDKSTKAHYEAGIRASMTQWKANMSDDFLTKEQITYDPSLTFEQQLEQIMQQKYFAFFFNDYQAWFEKRRTGYPVLPRGQGIPAENKFPSRVTYPTYLQSLNPQALKAGTDSMGGDNSDIKVWWEK